LCILLVCSFLQSFHKTNCLTHLMNHPHRTPLVIICIILLSDSTSFVAVRNSPMWSVPCLHVTRSPHFVDGSDDLQMWTVAANLLKRQASTNDEGWSFGMGLESGPNNFLSIVMKCYTDLQTSNNSGLLS